MTAHATQVVGHMHTGKQHVTVTCQATQAVGQHAYRETACDCHMSGHVTVNIIQKILIFL